MTTPLGLFRAAKVALRGASALRSWNLGVLVKTLGSVYGENSPRLKSTDARLGALMERALLLERVGVNAHYVQEGVWCVPVHVIGTEGNLSRWGFALTDNEDFWDFQESSEEDVLSWN